MILVQIYIQFLNSQNKHFLNLYTKQQKFFKISNKNGAGVTLRLSSSIIGDYKLSFPQNLSLTDKQTLNLCKAFPKDLSTDVKLSKAQIFWIVQLGGFLGKLVITLLKIDLPLVKNVLIPPAKSVLIPLWLTATVLVVDARIL